MFNSINSNNISFQFVIASLVAFAAANAVVSDDAHAEITLFKSDVRADGFDSALETSNSIHQVASGDEHGNIHGEYSYISPEGEHVSVSYVADENGYQPSSDLLPTPPPVPVAIVKALEYLRTHPQKEEYKH